MKSTINHRLHKNQQNNGFEQTNHPFQSEHRHVAN